MQKTIWNIIQKSCIYIFCIVSLAGCTRDITQEQTDQDPIINNMIEQTSTPTTSTELPDTMNEEVITQPDTSL
jgi:hypothetical protein